MKRKSILMTIVALLFAGVAWGQQIAWPTAVPAPQVKGSDTIFFCLTTDSLYPIELGYDVSGRRLSPEYGEWSLISKTSNDVKVADYNLDGTKNGGAGNAYKAVGSGKGGLLFQYTANNEQCGLGVGQKFWVFVFILPDFNNSVTKDTLICYKQSGTPVTIDYSKSFADYIDLYKKAGFSTSSWESGGSFNIKTDSIAKYSLLDSIELTGAPAGYTCGLKGAFSLSVTIDTIGQLKGLALGICATDTLGDLGNRNPNEIFKRSIPGTYSPEKINKWTTAEKTAMAKIFKFSYMDCDGSTPKTVDDTLYLIESHKWWGRDTVVTCRDGAQPSIFSFYNNIQIDYPQYPGKPVLTEGDSYWYDRALGVWPITDKGTTDGYFSMQGIVDPLYDYGTVLRLDSMKSNIGYHYLWRVEPGSHPCLVDPVTGAPDSGTIVVILQDPAIAMDYTAQLCKSGTYDLDLNAYTRLNVKWEGVNGTNGLNGADKKTIKVDSVYPGTYKYKYTIPAGCGAGGTGVFYLKVTSKIKVPSSKEVLYCVSKLPASINVNDVLGVVVNGLAWSGSVTTGGAPTTLDDSNGFDGTTGVLDIATYASQIGSGPATLTFQTTSGANCGVSIGTTLTIKFVTNL